MCSNIHVKSLKLTGNSLELFLLNYHGNIDNGENNYLGTVKKKKIGQSAAKFVLLKNYIKQRRSTTIIDNPFGIKV